MNRLFDYLVGAAKQREGKGGTKCLGGLKIDDHFEFVAARSRLPLATSKHRQHDNVDFAVSQLRVQRFMRL